jgi:DNA-binding transcriptional LysR family regulator
MRLSKKINWNLLYTFTILGETKSVSRTAEILGRGQPAVSAALKRLEEQVGHSLADRGPRYFRLTDAGNVLYREAREICGSIDRISSLLKDNDEMLTGNVRLTIASHMASPIIDQSLADFHRRYARATITVTVMNSRDMLEALADRLICFGIGPIHSKTPKFKYTQIFREYCGFYCGAAHPLFGRTNLTVPDLEGQSAITYRSAIDTDTLKSISDMRDTVRFADPFTGVANNLEEVRRMIVAGLGIGAIPVQVAARDVKDGLLWRLPPYEDVMPIDIYLIVNPAVRPSRAEAAYLEVLADTIEKTPKKKRVYRDNAARPRSPGRSA